MSNCIERDVEKLPLYDSFVNDPPIAGFAKLPTVPLTLPLERGNIATRKAFCVRLDLEDLSCFSQVDQQYKALGVQFKNAIAINPSNPAYAPHSGSMVIMGGPENGWIEATFTRPVRCVSSFITSSRRTVMMAFDDQDRFLAQTESSDGNLKQTGNRSAKLHLQLNLQADNIRRVTFHSINGQITLTGFCFYI